MLSENMFFIVNCISDVAKYSELVFPQTVKDVDYTRRSIIA